MKRRIAYIFLLVITLYLEIVYNSWTFLGLLLLEISLPIVSWILWRIAVSRLEATVAVPLGVAEKNQPFTLGISVKNKSFVPLVYLDAKLRLANLFYGKALDVELQGMAEIRSMIRLLQTMTSSHCGILEITLPDGIVVKDFLGLFSKRLKVQAKERLVVMPEEYTAQVFIAEDTRAYLAESEDYHPSKAGDDPSEIFQVREYHDGDRLQSIHWKMSARCDDWMVREYSLPVHTAVIYFLDSFAADAEFDPDVWMEAALAISRGMLEQSCDHYAVWYDYVNEDIKRLEIRDEEDIYRLVGELFGAGLNQKELALEELYREKYHMERWQTCLMLRGNMELLKNGEIICDLRENTRNLLENGELWI